MDFKLTPVFLMPGERNDLTITEVAVKPKSKIWASWGACNSVNGRPTNYWVKLAGCGRWRRVRLISYPSEHVTDKYFIRYASSNLWIPKEIFEGLKQMADAVKISPGEQKEI